MIADSPIAGWTPARTAEQLLFELERQRRRIEAQITTVMATVDQQGLYAEDGHLSTRAWAMAITNWSPVEATARVRMAKTLTVLPAVNQAFTARASWGRVRCGPSPALTPTPEWCMTCPTPKRCCWKMRSPFGSTSSTAGSEPGPNSPMPTGRIAATTTPTAIRAARITDVGDETLIAANVGTLHGAVMREIFAAFSDAEFALDVDAAGPGGVLARTDSQRRADALLAIFHAAAEGGKGGSLQIVVNVVVDQTTFERELRRMAGATVERPDPTTYRTAPLRNHRRDPHRPCRHRRRRPDR